MSGWCKILNSNPVLIAPHFQGQGEAFCNKIVLDGSLRKSKDHAVHVELQVMRNLHIHLFIWILNSP